MGFSTPKEPFNLADFLSEKGQPRSRLRPTWKRSQPQAAQAEPAPGPDLKDDETKK